MKDKEEIIKVLAEKVMGWRKGLRMTVKYITNDLPAYDWVDSEGKKRVPVNLFVPLTDISQAFQVVDRMRELGFTMKMTHHSKDTAVCFFADTGIPAGFGREDTPAMAICKAAYEAKNDK